MKDHQCLVIGISRYQFLPPLSYGEVDAQAIYQFFLNKVKLPQQQILLISDTSVPVKGRSTYPSQENLLEWLKLSDQEWLIFNGYGVNYQGEDYLMPIDGNPQDILSTGIKIQSLFSSLQTPKLLILNLYSLQLGTRVGQQIITLAKQKGIALILSVRPADEKTSDNHSTFTTALLEAFEYYSHDISLFQLAQYLSDRLPSLRVSRGRMIATPVIISPSLTFSSQSLFSLPKSQKTENTEQPKTSQEKEIGLPLLPAAAVATIPDNTEENLISQAPVSPPQSSHSLKSHQSVKWVWVGGILMVLLLIGLSFWLKSILLNPPNYEGSKFPLDPSNKDADSQQKLLHRAMTYLKENQASSFNRAINEIRQIPQSSSVYPQAQEKITLWSQIILDIAQGRANQGNFQDAIAAARLVPPDQKQVYSLALEKIKTWQAKAKQQQINQALIDGAKALINPFSASSYNQGITILRQIVEGEPEYPQAQQLINQWSQKIYLLALSRANQGNYQQAITTAELVPPDTFAYDIAREAIAQWKLK
ncbi:peptidase C14 caspase catalytic subunit p20 [Gloeothece citriformis PCC 7424]|uniref:Peptidase C14 caspase catalytic subunit p20 n=1 Tax=Gloeothece citriformis (strain PCC 7424) TaxID=65393 RepID=B7KL36_GLOC7|nr:caspase family protein [Gloeothece citriformis]ACK72408.1 peptidase C14 caspase catalytic subunit p20 [Gloeothece citriformis PCC 7424]